MMIRMVWMGLGLLLASCAGSRPVREAPDAGAAERSLRARIDMARGEAAADSRRWGLAAAYFAAARAEQDSPQARWSQAWAMGHASQRLWSRKFEGSVLGFAFSPDGRMLASASYDSVVRLWDVGRGELLAELKGHTAEVHAVAFSPDSRWLASGGRPGEIRIWDMHQGKQVAVLHGHSDVIRGLVFSPSGRLLASCGVDKTVRVWDVSTGTERMRFAHDEYAIAVVFSGDERQLLSTSMDRSARLWDLGTGKELRRFVGHEEKVESAALSVDGQRLMTAAADHTVRFWNLQSGQLLDVLKSQSAGAAVAIDPRFQLLVQAGWDGRVELLDARTGELLERLDAHRSMAMAVALSPDGSTFVSGGRDGTLNVWSRPRLPAETVLRGHDVWVEAVALPEEQMLVSAGEDGLRSWDLSKGDAPSPSPIGSGAVSLAVSPDRKFVAAGGPDGRVRVLEAGSWRELLTLSVGTESVRALAFSPDGTILAAGGERDILLWAVPSGTVIGQLTGHAGKVWALAFDPTGKRLASGGLDKSARVWDVGSRQQVLQLDTGGMVRAVAFTPADGLLVTAGMQQPIRIWDAADGHRVKILESNEVGTLSIALSSDGRWMASGEMDLSVQVWLLPSGERVGTIRGHQGMPAAVAFSPGASTLASASADRTIHLSRIDGVTQATPALPGLEEVLRRYGLTRNPEQFLIQYR